MNTQQKMVLDAILDQTYVRDFGRADARGDELPKSVAVIDERNAVIVYERRYGRVNDRGVRTVVLGRDTAADKWRVNHDAFTATPDNVTVAAPAPVQPIERVRPRLTEAELRRRAEDMFIAAHANEVNLLIEHLIETGCDALTS